MEGTYEVSILNTDGEDETARTVTLSAGEEYIIYHKVKRYDIDREQLGIVRGTITEPTGEPLSGYTVCLYTLEEFADGTSRADKEVQRCIIAKDGKFKFIGIPEGDYTLVMLNRNGTINEVAGTIRFHDIEKFYRDTAYWTYTNVTWEIPKESIYN
jgi:hypothetical protein